MGFSEVIAEAALGEGSEQCSSGVEQSLYVMSVGPGCSFQCVFEGCTAALFFTALPFPSSDTVCVCVCVCVRVRVCVCACVCLCVCVLL